jgi:hypothetical protein
MKINACPRCGSKSIQMGRIRDGVLFGIDSWKQVCRQCGYQGAPIIFDSETEYQKFLEELKVNGKQRKKEDKSLELSEKEKEVVEFLKELEKEKPIKNKEVKKEEITDRNDEVESKMRWIVFLISVAISALLVVLMIPYFLSQYDFITAIIAIVGFFIVLAFWSVLLTLLFIRFLYKETKNVLQRK